MTRLRPFFSYFGAKYRMAATHFPPPRFDTIVEPFAGSAGYSMRYPERAVLLVDADPVVVEVWKFLIRAQAEEIMALPDLKPGQTVDDLQVSQEARWLIGFWLNRACTEPRAKPSAWMRSGIWPNRFWGQEAKRRIAEQVAHIRHWQIHNCSYSETPFDGEATWFIDPPYQEAGCRYRFGSRKIDFAALAEWSRERRGQVMVCENEGASWLPFRSLASVKSQRNGRRSSEVWWTNDTDCREMRQVEEVTP